MRTLINTVETYRVDLEADVRPFIEEQKENGHEEGYDVISYKSDYKERKRRAKLLIVLIWLLLRSPIILSGRRVMKNDEDEHSVVI